MSTKETKSRFYYVRVGREEVRVKATSHADAVKAAKAGKGRCVGVYF